MAKIDLAPGTLEYRDHGSGPPVLLIHGLLVNGGVWDGVVRELSAHARCIVPELPLGSHRTAMNAGADLTPAGAGERLA